MFLFWKKWKILVDMLFLSYREFEWLKIVFSKNQDHTRHNIIRFQTEQDIALFYNLDHFMYFRLF